MSKLLVFIIGDSRQIGDTHDGLLGGVNGCEYIHYRTSTIKLFEGRDAGRLNKHHPE